ncbi:glutathione S-transferase family protein [Sinorhizobium fredii]|uniref:glutathione S-transferase family protein n=1 Tax=Rhizobium fredii TaxID=380 RepID=UPI000693F3C1|nr:glutathione S-transferase family protein [Sinorhizobium fredii]WOS62610.1 glutathione S-transferase family protein [Sinorhizobium fredii GR64]
MKLYYDPITTSSRSVTFFLFDQEIPFEEEVVSTFAGEQRTSAFARVNPNQQLPVLDDDGFVLTQSSAILKYLADRLGSATYPSEPRQRARVDEAMGWFGTNFHVTYCVFLAYRRMIPEMLALNPATHVDLERIGQAVAAKYLSVLDRNMLSGRQFVCGDEITIADYLGFSHVTLGEYIDFDFSPYPNIKAWLSRMKTRIGHDAAYASFRGFVQAAHSQVRAS